MTIYFRSCRNYVTRDKHDPKRRWYVYEFKTTGGVITLIQRMKVARLERTVTYARDRDGRWRSQPSRKVTEILTRDRQNKRR